MTKVLEFHLCCTIKNQRDDDKDQTAGNVGFNLFSFRQFFFVCAYDGNILREDLLASRQRAGGLMFGCTSLAIPHGRAEPRSIKHVHIVFFFSSSSSSFLSIIKGGKRGSSFLFRVGGALSGYATTRASLMMRPLPYRVRNEEKRRMKNIRGNNNMRTQGGF